MVPEENFLLVGYSSLHIVYENMVLPSYHFFVTAVAEKKLILVWEVCTQITIFLSKMHHGNSYSEWFIRSKYEYIQ